MASRLTETLSSMIFAHELLDGRLDIPLRRIFAKVSKELGNVALMHCPLQQICESISYSTPTQGFFFFALCCLGKIPGGAPFSQLHKSGNGSRVDRP